MQLHITRRDRLHPARRQQRRHPVSHRVEPTRAGIDDRHDEPALQAMGRGVRRSLVGAGHGGPIRPALPRRGRRWRLLPRQEERAGAAAPATLSGTASGETQSALQGCNRRGIAGLGREQRWAGPVETPRRASFFCARAMPENPRSHRRTVRTQRIFGAVNICQTAGRHDRLKLPSGRSGGRLGRGTAHEGEEEDGAKGVLRGSPAPPQAACHPSSGVFCGDRGGQHSRLCDFTQFVGAGVPADAGTRLGRDWVLAGGGQAPRFQQRCEPYRFSAIATEPNATTKPAPKSSAGPTSPRVPTRIWAVPSGSPGM